MSVTINAKGTSVPYFTIGKNGNTIYQGSTDPSGSYTIHAGDYWLDSANNSLSVWNTTPSAGWYAPELAGITFTNSGGVNTITSSTGQDLVLTTDSTNYVDIATSDGPIYTLGTITPGSGYDAGGTHLYTDVPLTGGHGSGAIADIQVTSGAVTSVVFTGGGDSYGTGYMVGDVLSASNTNLGGSGSGFHVSVAAIAGSALITTSNGQDLHINPATGGGNYLWLNADRWPAADGTANQVLQTNGSGILSWYTVSGGSPGSPNHSIQFNSSGSFAGDANFTFTDVSNNPVMMIGYSYNGGSNLGVIAGTDASVSGFAPAVLTVRGGNSTVSGGAVLNLTGGSGTSGAGGGVNVTGGATTGNTYNGGTVVITGGGASGTSSVGGDIQLITGAGTSGHGELYIQTGTGKTFVITADNGAWQIAGSAGTSGQVLTSGGASAQPLWTSQSGLSVGTATNATNVATTNNTSSGSTWYPTFVSATSGNNPITVDGTSGALSFVPSTGTLSATVFSGAGTGLTGTASSLNASVAISDVGSTNTTYNVLFTTADSGTTTTLDVSTSTLTFNPDTSTLNIGPGFGSASIIKNATGKLTVEGNTVQVGTDTAVVNVLMTDSSGITMTTNGAAFIVGPNGDFSLAGTTGTAGQVLTSNAGGTPPTWQAPSGSQPTISDVSTNSTFYPTFTSATSGTLSTIDVSSTALTWNPGTYSLTLGDPTGGTAFTYIYSPSVSTGLSTGIVIKPGTVTGTATSAGDVTLNGGIAAISSATGGSVNIVAGTSTGVAANQGSIFLVTGTVGNVALQIDADTATGANPGAWTVYGSGTPSAGNVGDVLVSGGPGVSPGWGGPNSPLIGFVLTTISGNPNYVGTITGQRTSGNASFTTGIPYGLGTSRNLIKITSPGYYMLTIRNQYETTATETVSVEIDIYTAAGTGWIDYTSPLTDYQKYWMNTTSGEVDADQFINAVVYVDSTAASSGSSPGPGALINWNYTTACAQVRTTITLAYMGP